MEITPHGKQNLSVIPTKRSDEESHNQISHFVRNDKTIKA
jgi:hypothetical protein